MKREFFLKDNIGTFIKWLFCSALVGAVVGAAGVLFHFALSGAAGFFALHSRLVYLLPLVGLLIAWLYKATKMENDKGTNAIFVSIRSNEKVRLVMAPLIFIGTALTHLFGGSAGREGAALQLGGSIAHNMGVLFKMDEKDKKLITMCGMSAAFAALFGTPLTAAVFSIEVISVGVMYYAALVPCIVSAAVGAGLAKLCGIAPTAFTLLNVPEGGFPAAGRVIILSFLTALLGIVFCFVLENTKKYFGKIKNSYLRALISGGLIVILTLIVGSFDYNGAGMSVIERAIAGEARPEAFLLKMIFTAVTLSGGFRGGEIVPVFFTGATFGNTVARLIGLSPSFGAGIGLISLFCAVTNCPITSLILSIELFGANGLIFFAAAVAISYMMSGYSGLYAEQKIMYSKLRPEFIDKKVE